MFSSTDIAMALLFVVGLVAAFMAAGYAVAWISESLKSVLHARRVTAFLAGLPGNQDYVMEDGLIEVFDIYTGHSVRGVWASTL